MIREKSVLAVMIARGGSKGVPRKNVRLLAGKPLIAWTIDEAKKSKYIDRLILSSEDAEIIEVAKRLGCDVPFVRPQELARDEVSGLETVLHAIDQLPGFDYVVMLQPTSPLRSVDDIDGCIAHCIERGANVCATVSEPDKTPYWMFRLDGNEIMQPVIPGANEMRMIRQNLPKTYALNGSVFVAKTDWLRERKRFLTDETLAYITPKERSVDIDSELDWMLIEQIIRMQT